MLTVESELKVNQKTIHKIISKEENQFTNEDFQIVFNKYSTYLNYQDGKKMVFACLQRMETSNEIRSIYPDSLLWWMNKNRIDFVNDGIDIDELIYIFMKKLLSTFVFFNLTDVQCEKLGLNFRYSIGPYNRDTVRDIIDEITIYCNGLIENNILDWLSNEESIEKSLWFLELALHSRTWCLIQGVDDNIDFRRQSFFQKAHNFRLFRNAIEIFEKNECDEKYKDLMMSFI